MIGMGELSLNWERQSAQQQILFENWFEDLQDALKLPFHSAGTNHQEKILQLRQIFFVKEDSLRRTACEGKDSNQLEVNRSVPGIPGDGKYRKRATYRCI